MYNHPFSMPKCSNWGSATWMWIYRSCGEGEGMMFRQFFNTVLQLEWINRIAGGRFLIPVGDPVGLCTCNRKRYYNRKEGFSIEGVKAHVLTDQEQPACSGNLPLLEEHGWEVSGVLTSVSALCQKGGSTDYASLICTEVGLLLCHIIPVLCGCHTSSYLQLKVF